MDFECYTHILRIEDIRLKQRTENDSFNRISQMRNARGQNCTKSLLARRRHFHHNPCYPDLLAEVFTIRVQTFEPLTVLPVQIDVRIPIHSQLKATSHIRLCCCHHKIILVVEWEIYIELKLLLARTRRILCDQILGGRLRIELMNVEIAISVQVIGASKGVASGVDSLDSDDFVVVEVRFSSPKSSKL